MNKTKEINSIFVYRSYQYKDIELSFFNRIYKQCNLMNIGIIKKIWFDYQHCHFFLWDLYSGNEKDKKFLFL